MMRVLLILFGTIFLIFGINMLTNNLITVLFFDGIQGITGTNLELLKILTIWLSNAFTGFFKGILRIP